MAIKRKRMIDPGIWDDRGFCLLSIPASRLAIHLISASDDLGRGYCYPDELASDAFKLKASQFDEAAIESMLAEIEENMAFIRYADDRGRPCFAWRKWFSVQKIDRPSKSKIAPPPADVEIYIPDLYDGRGNEIGWVRQILDWGYDSYRPNGIGVSRDIKPDPAPAAPADPDKPVMVIHFTPPTVEEVSSYCADRGNGIDAHRFVDFYAARGWMIGKSRMKDWKAAVRTWEGRDKDGQQSEVRKYDVK